MSGNTAENFSMTVSLPSISYGTWHNFNHVHIFSMSIPECFGKCPNKVPEVSLYQHNFLIKPLQTRAATLQFTSTSMVHEICNRRTRKIKKARTGLGLCRNLVYKVWIDAGNTPERFPGLLIKYFCLHFISSIHPLSRLLSALESSWEKQDTLGIQRLHCSQDWLTWRAIRFQVKSDRFIAWKYLHTAIPEL